MGGAEEGPGAWRGSLVGGAPTAQGQQLADDAAAIVRFSADRYLAWIAGDHDDLI